MSQEKQRWPRDFAEIVAGQLTELFEPHCKRIQVAGSLRRGKAEVGDIELLCISKVLSSSDLFGQYATNCYALDVALDHIVKDGGVLEKRVNSLGRTTYGEKNKLLVHSTGIPVDIFNTTTDNWGMALVVRTGPREFNIRMMSRFHELGMKGHAYGGVSRGSEQIACPTEETVFDLLEWDYIPSEERA